MGVVEASALGSSASRLLVKPFNDLYEAAKGKIKGISEKWDRIAEVEAAYEILAAVQNVNTITSNGPIPLTSFYYAPRLFVGSDDKQKQVDHLSEISDSKNILVLGTAGQGKSTLLRYLCFQELQLGARIPVFVELRDVDEKTDLKALMKQHLSFLGVRNMTEEILTFFLDSARFAFFFDGFDEVKREFAHSTQTSIKTLVAAHPKTRWVISSRPGSLGDHLTSIPEVMLAKIAPLTPDDFDPFLERLGVEKKARRSLIEAIRTSPTAIKNVLTTPLMLTLLNSTFGTSTYIPPTLHEFYENMFHVLVARHDLTKPYYVRQKATKLTSADLQTAFAAFCFFSKEYSVSLTDEQFQLCAKRAAKLTGLDFTPEGLKTDLSDSVCLMVRDGLKTAFLHKSIQEFFAAYFVKSLGEPDKASKIYEKIRCTTWPSWQQELQFLGQIDKHRYIEHYRLPAIVDFLTHVGYSAGARVPLTKKKFETYIKRLEVYRIIHEQKIALPEAFFLLTDDGSVSCIVREFLYLADKRAFVINTSKQEYETITREIGGVRFERLSNYVKESQNVYFSKLRELCDRLEKERVRLSKTLEERNQNFKELVGI